MSSDNNLCRLFCLLVLVPLAASVMAQDQEVEEFSQNTVFLKGEKGYEANFSIRYITNQVAVERYAAQFFFDDTVSVSLSDAIAAFTLTFDKDVFDSEKNKIVGGYGYQMSMIGGHQGKYQCYFLKRVVKKQKGKKVVTKTKQCGIVYDVKGDRVLTAQDVFSKDYLKRHKIKSPIDMYMDDMGVVWNFPDSKEPYRVHYLMSPESFTEEFHKLLGREKVLARSGTAGSRLAGTTGKKVYASVEEVARNTSAGTDGNNGEVLKAKETVTDEKPQSVENKVFDVVEQMPEYPGGQGALMKWLSENIEYPAIAEKNGIQGRVVCTFVVERDGSVSDVRVIRSLDPSLDKEAVRVLGKMPQWNPGKQNGIVVRVKYTIPVTFQLQSTVKKSPIKVTR